MRSEREPMTPAERASFERRVARTYAQDVPIKDMERRFGIHDQEITDIARRYGVPLRALKSDKKRKVA